MDSFQGRLAVVTGGGSGIGRELALQLAAAGCAVAAADLDLSAAERTAAIAAADSAGAVTAHRCDVADPESVARLRDEVLAAHDADHVELLFNNAGIAGAGSFLADDRAAWERVFAICWGGVYNCARAFMPLLVASDEAWLVNTSSVNGFWAMHGPGDPSTAYATAKFAVKGFSEALIEDLRKNAPHVNVAVVMPGTIGTGIVANSAGALGAVDAAAKIEDEALREFSSTSAAEAAATILAGVLAGHWRILVGADAHELDAAVRADPASIYDPGFPGLREPPWLAPMMLLRSGFDPVADPELTAVVELRGAGERIAIELAPGRLAASRGAAAGAPAATLEVEPEVFRGLLAGEESLRQAEARAALVLSGDGAVVERLLAATRRAG